LKSVSTVPATLQQPPAEDIQLTWLGHASALVQMEGVNFLTDPVWANRVSPISFFGPKRLQKVPLPLEKLPPIHFVVISHNHYDHLDQHVVKTLGNSPLWIVPLGLKAWFESVGVTNVVELNWWQSHQYNSDITVACTPCQHWSKRTAFDTRKTLWSSWCVIGKKKRVFFSGDTGMCTVFKAIGKKYGPFDLSLIAIGAYCPRDFMKPQHVDPYEAVQIHTDLGSKKSVGIHWGTYRLTAEPLDEPPRLLATVLKEKGLLPTEFITTLIGQTVIVPKDGDIQIVAPSDTVIEADLE